jgi:hypothetical protein
LKERFEKIWSALPANRNVPEQQRCWLASHESSKVFVWSTIVHSFLSVLARELVYHYITILLLINLSLRERGNWWGIRFVHSLGRRIKYVPAIHLTPYFMTRLSYEVQLTTIKYPIPSAF